MHDRVYMCSLRHPSPFSYTREPSVHFCLLSVAVIFIPSTNTASWSLKRRMTWVLMIRLTLLVALYKQDINNVTVLCKIDYKFKAWLSRQSANFQVSSGKRHILEIGNCASSQFIQGSSCLLLYTADTCNFIIIINNVVLIIIQHCLWSKSQSISQSTIQTFLPVSSCFR